jgi:hypothetical protein
MDVMVLLPVGDKGGSLVAQERQLAQSLVLETQVNDALGEDVEHFSGFTRSEHQAQWDSHIFRDSQRHRIHRRLEVPEQHIKLLEIGIISGVHCPWCHPSKTVDCVLIERECAFFALAPQALDTFGKSLEDPLGRGHPAAQQHCI